MLLQDTQIQDQLNVLNKAFNQHGIQFSLALITRTVNPAWSKSTPGSASMFNMKQSRHIGGPADLNLYIQTSIGAGDIRLRGFATYPSDYQQSPVLDGISIIHASLPGGKAPFQLGHSAVQQVGHWFGLYNTFQGGCAAPGDYVDDTPPEASPAYGCPKSRDTCPGGGPDPIHNYMDYTDE